MKVKLLFEGQFKIVATMEGDDCPAERFLHEGEEATEGQRLGLIQLLEFLAENGLGKASHAWIHEANKQEQIYEFIKGPLRLFFFKGSDGHIAVCTNGGRKKGPKADKALVASASALRTQYENACKEHTLEVIEDEED